METSPVTTSLDRNRLPPTRFGRELNRLLRLLGVKRSALTERGYSYSLHKQLCRGERRPSPRALGSLTRILDRHLVRRQTVLQKSAPRLAEWVQELASFDWLSRHADTGLWTVDAAALARLWEPRVPPPKTGDFPVMISGWIRGLPAGQALEAPDQCLRIKGVSISWQCDENGNLSLVIPLADGSADRLRKRLALQSGGEDALTLPNRDFGTSIVPEAPSILNSPARPPAATKRSARPSRVPSLASPPKTVRRGD